MAAMWAPVMSAHADMVGFVVPVLLAMLILPLTFSTPPGEVPLHWKLVLEVLVDVAHVYGTICRTVLDSEATARNWGLYLLAVPGLLIPTLVVNIAFGVWLGWSLLAYYAMYHFAKQPFGLLCFYKATQGERGAFDHRLDYWTCMAAALIPILLWHADAFGDFRWFNAEDQRLFSLPPIYRRPLWALYGVLPSLWFLRVAYKYTRGSALNLGKIWIMAATYFTWYMGFTEHLVRRFAFIDLFHGVSSMAVVYHVVRHRYRSWRDRKPETLRWTDRLCEAMVSTPGRYVSLLASLAIVEELAWEVLVHQQYLPSYGRALPVLTEGQNAVVTSVLMLPQLSHYFLDAYIWKLAPRNPGLREAVLGMSGASDKRRVE